jgi:hypothetical protein
MAELTLTDVSGKAVLAKQLDCPAGYNEFRLNAAELPATGVLYYTLKTEGESATRKMIVVE